MASTFPALIASVLATDPGRPLVTYYDEATGERVELSVATYANWVAKGSSLLVEEFDLERGQRLLIDLPTHWLGPIFMGAAWTAGLVVVFPDQDGVPDAVVCGPEGLAAYADLADRIPVVASALLPLGVRFAEPLPAGVHDFGIEVWSQPDSFIPWDPPGPDDPALVDRTQAELLAPTAHPSVDPVGGGGRLLTTANPASPTGLATFVEPLVSGGSTVWVRNPASSSLERLYAEERATAQLVP